MLRTKMIELDSVLKDVYFMLREQDVSEDFIMENAIKAMDYLSVYKTYDHKVCYLYVNNYQAELPINVLGIEAVMYKFDQRSIDDEHIAILHLKTEDEGLNIQYKYELTNIHKLNALQNKNWKFLKLNESPFSKSIVCNPFMDLNKTCNEWYQPDLSNNRLVFSFSSGIVAVAYFGFPQTNGKFLIPDVAIVADAIKSYVLAKTFEKQWLHSIQGAREKFTFYNDEWDRFALAAIGTLSKLSLPEYYNMAKKNTMFKDYPASKYYGGFSNEKLKL